MSAPLPLALLLLFSYVRAQATTCGTCIGSPRDPSTGNIRCDAGRSSCFWCQVGGGGFCYQPALTSCSGTVIDTTTSCPIPPSPIAAAALTGAVGQSVALPCVCCLVCRPGGFPPAPYRTLTLTLAQQPRPWLHRPPRPLPPPVHKPGAAIRQAPDLLPSVPPLCARARRGRCDALLCLRLPPRGPYGALGEAKHSRQPWQPEHRVHGYHVFFLLLPSPSALLHANPCLPVY